MSQVRRTPEIARLETGVRNLDNLFSGGVPAGTVTVVAGPPGSGKTILAEQICFHSATTARPALYFRTLSEPTAKALRYLQQFSFFDAEKLGAAVQFVDLGILTRGTGLDKTLHMMMEHIKRVEPAIVVVDSFKVFNDLSRSPEELRKFGYEVVINLMAWQSTALLLGEYAPKDYEQNPIFSVVDGLWTLTQREEAGEHRRLLRIVKMRGTDHVRDEHTFEIDERGIHVYAPRVTIRRSAGAELPAGRPVERLRLGIDQLDLLVGPGIPLGSSLLVSGAAGTGKSLLLLEFVYRGALMGERGILFSFEETAERLLGTARTLGWDLDGVIARGMVEIVFIPQPDILLERDMLMMQEHVERFGARRVAVDSVSVFLHKVRDAEICREKVFQLASIVQNQRAVGMFATDVPYGSDRISRFGVEETVVDGVVLLTAVAEGLERPRYLEIYKLRNTSHQPGRHPMRIGPDGIKLFPRYMTQVDLEAPPLPLDTGERLSAGVVGLDALLGGGLLRRSVTLVSGSAGIGKTTLGLQFLVEGAERGEPGIFVSAQESPAQLLAGADVLGIPLRRMVDADLIRLIHFSREQVRAGQFASVLVSAVTTRGARRLMLDDVEHLAGAGLASDQLRGLLHGLGDRFKALGVTSMFGIEALSLHATGFVTEEGLFPVADNLLLMRYVADTNALVRTLQVIKTRLSSHDAGTHALVLGPGGLRVGDRLRQTPRGDV